MNDTYLINCLKQAKLSDAFIDDARYYFSEYGWRQSIKGDLYIIGVTRDQYDFYWACATRDLSVIFVSFAFKMEKEVYPEFRKFSSSEYSKVKHNFDEAVKKSVESRGERMIVSIFDNELGLDVMDIFREETIEDPVKEIELDDLSQHAKAGLLDYALKRLNDTEPMEIHMSRLETMRYNYFCEKHRMCRHSGEFDVNSFTSNILLRMRPSGIGMAFSCECECCGAKEDITDVGNW